MSIKQSLPTGERIASKRHYLSQLLYIRRGIVNLSRRGMLFVSVAQQLGSGNSFARLFCCPLSSQAGRKKAPSAR